MKNKSNRQAAKRTKSSQATVPLPVGAVKLVFHGLMAFSYNQSGECIVGFHSKGDKKHQHSLTINTYDQSCNLAYPSENVSKSAKLQMIIDKPDLNQASKALFYQPNGKLDRKAAGSVDQDFQWIMDLESEYFYGQSDLFPNGLPKKSGVYAPTLAVAQGIFYTIKKTRGEFSVQTKSGKYHQDLGQVAEYIGAYIYLLSGGSVMLLIDGKATPPLTKGEIHFNNLCENPIDHDSCNKHWNYFDFVDKSNRNDFYLHTKGFDLQGKPELELFLTKAVVGSQPPGDICRPKLVALSDDNAPCAGAGYGGPGGFPPYP